MFNINDNTKMDIDLTRKFIHEQIEIAGVEMKYYPVKTFKGMHDKAFTGEDPNIKFYDPIICKAILITTPEATRIFQAMGINTTESLSFTFEKEQIVSLLGRRPMARDRVTILYNNSNFEITNILEEPPTVFWETFILQVNAQKIVESWEDRELLYTKFLTPSGALPFSAIPTSSHTAIINTVHITSESGAIESAASAMGSGFGHADTGIFGRW